MRFYLHSFFIVSFFCVVLNAEPSAFELQSGATKKELKTLQSSSKNLENILTDLQNRVFSLEQIQDGLKSLFEGQTLKIKNLSDSSATYENSIKSLQATQDLHTNTLKQQAELIGTLKKQIEENQHSIKDLDKKVTELSELLSNLNKTLISQIDLIKKSLDIPTPTPKVSTGSKSSSKASSNEKHKTTESKALPKTSFDKDVSKKKEIFDDVKKNYRKDLEGAKAKLQWLVEINYKPANSLYLLGEIAYKQKKYQDAIAFYKKSALLDDKASYMPILLWHTAWSFRYLKDMKNYNKFLNSLIYLYPDSEQGQRAKKDITIEKAKK